ncbi:YegS/Rv2252/BmrU family lipid kinase [Galbibacter sp. PAP.153]|uniref:diacylglycerol/lipid kinase family protein n=1 Tax=Galbibacter sp. PAP.153 TaxID=3104623 RepID=UPI0030092CE9
MNTAHKILLVVNPISGNTKKENIIEQAQKEAKAIKKQLEIYTTKGKSDKDNLIKLLEKNHFEKLIIAGGDGTIKLGVSAVMEIHKNIPIGIIPAGSANGMAVELNLPLDIQKAIRHALKNTPKPVDIVQINGEASIHISDIGINAALIKNYDQSNIRGKLGYALQSIPTLINFKEPFHYKINANGKVFSGDAIMVAFANAQKYGNGAVINPQGKLNDGKFEILIFKSLQIPKILETVFNEVPIDEEFIEIIKTNKAVINTKNPVPLQIDGEYGRETNFVEISIAHKQLQIIY